MNQFSKFAIITPDRNDRKELLQHCREQVKRFHFKAEHYVINYKAETEDCDLIPRVKKGIDMAKAEGCEWVVIVENDDHYPADYLDRIIPYMQDMGRFGSYDFIGDPNTTYYNLRNRTYSEMSHAGRASLFTTSFRISALEGFKWPVETSPFLDIPLWEFGRKKRRCKFIQSGAVGIKHGIGKAGGSGHRRTLANSDPELEYLKSKVDEVSFLFYNSLQL